MVLETVPYLQGSQLAVMIYMALELSQIKRAMKTSEAIDYEKPAIFEEMIPIKTK